MTGQPAKPEEAELETLLEFVRDARGFDFTGYKRSSLTRRIRKRMIDVKIPGYVDYRDHLESNAEEFQYLFNTILINVTGFFRDAEAWSLLQSEVLPQLLSEREPEEEIRVWSAGCSSGEEAYSLAIAFAECMGIDECAERVKIYGTDVDDEALSDARSGLYQAKAMDRLPEELKRKYFEPSGDRFAFRPDLRRRVIFGRHDITQDAPLSRLDLLACRNTLMYFNVETQASIVDRFHFALRDGGCLFLGKAEMLLSDGDRFDAANIRQRMFRRRPGPASATHRPVAVKFDPPAGEHLRHANRKRLVGDLALEASPNAVLGVENDGTVTLINAQARAQFGLTAHDVGKPFRDLELSYRPVELRSLIEQAHNERRPVRLNSVERRIDENETQYLDILVKPLYGTDGGTVGTAISFIDTSLTTRLQHEVKQIREDLETAYEELQSTNEELETTNEELQSSIEELETTNEELQSTNEELETTNEELHSGNEELETMNEEMRIRSAELDETRTFLEGVLGSVAAGVVVLDGELKVRSWNTGAEDLWGLRADEVLHQYFFALDFGLPTESLLAPIQDCLTSGERAQSKVDSINRKGRLFVCQLSCSPLNGPGEGVVLLMEADPAR